MNLDFECSPQFTVQMPYNQAERLKIGFFNKMYLQACKFLVSMQSLSGMPGRVSGCFNHAAVSDTLSISPVFFIK